MFVPPKPSSQTVASDRTFPGAGPALAVLMLINLFNYLDRQVLAAVVPHIEKAFFGSDGIGDSGLGPFFAWFQAHFGFKPQNTLLGLLSMAFMVIYMTAAPIFGRMAEHRSRWMLVGVGIILWSLASGASGLAFGFGVLLATRCCVGIGEAAYGPVAPALLSDYFPIQKRGRVLSWFYMAIPVGCALGYVVGDQVARSSIGSWGQAVLGLSSESWRWAFYLVMPPGVLLGVLSFFMREPPRGQSENAQVGGQRRPTWGDYAILLRTPSYVLCTMGMTAMTFAMGGIGFWMPAYLENHADAPRSSTTIFGAVMVGAGFAGTLLGGLLGDKLRRRVPGSYFVVSGVAMILGFPAFWYALRSSFPGMWVLLFLTCFCLFFNTGPTNTILANVTHPMMRAAAFAFNILVIHALGDVISPVIIGMVSDRYSLATAFNWVAFMFLVSGVCWLCGARYLERDMALAPTRLGDPANKLTPRDPRPSPEMNS